jgi:hypothetical protein
MITMAGKSRSDAERLAKILDGLGDFIRTAPGDELLEVAREEARNPAAVTARIKGLLTSALKAHQQEALVAAREGYQRALVTMSEPHVRLPGTAKGRRNWFQAVLIQAPQLQAAFTLQNRELSDISDEDIESHLQKLASLGVLDAVSLPEEE